MFTAWMQIESAVKREEKKLRDLPSVQEHVEGEPPELESLVRPVNEDTVDRHRPRGIHLAHRHCIVREETQLEQKQTRISSIKSETDMRR